MVRKLKLKTEVLTLLLFSIGLVSVVLQQALSTCDYWWHLKAGEWMLDHQTLPFQDVFSWFASEHQLYWISHEWLSEVVLASFNHLITTWLPGSTPHFSGYLFTCLSLFVLFGWIALFNQKYYLKNTYLTIGWFFFGALLFMSVASPRPHLMSYLLLTLTLWSLEQFRAQKGFKWLCFIPLWSFLWVNFHGGSSNLPYLLCLIYLMGGLFEFEWRGLSGKRWTLRQQKELLLITLCTFIALIFNPHGLQMITYPYENLQDTYMLSIIQEWQPPLLRLNGHLLILCQLVVLVFVLLFKKKNLSLIDFLLLGGFTYLAIGSARFAPILYILSSFILLPYLEGLITFQQKLPLELNRPIYQLILGGAGFSFLLLWSFQLPLYQETVFPTFLTPELLSVIQEESPQRLYNHYDLGSELIYHEIPVFVDGRADLYSKNILRDAVQLGFVEQDPVTLFEKYQFDYVLTFEQSPLGYYLKTFPNATLIASDAGVVFYELHH